MSSIGHGCKLCDGDSVKTSIKIPICNFDDHNYTNEELPSDTEYIKYCEFYELPSAEADITSLDCKKCYYEFVVSSDRKSCFEKGTTLIGCEIALNSTSCQTCEDIYVKVGTKCELKNIFGCVTYI